MKIDIPCVVVVYIRVSTLGQDITMQKNAARNLIEEYGEDNVRVIVDEGVSALKLRMNDRPGLQQILNMIRSGEVQTLIVYSRDRLARNFYEYLEIAKLLLERKVNVVFTQENARPFSDDLVLEAIYGIFAQIDGRTIQRRSLDARKHSPTRLLGYNRTKDSHGKVSYTLNEGVAADIAAMFEEISECGTSEEFFNLLMKYKKLLSKQPNRLIGILQTPFYAGYWLARGELKQIIPDIPHITDLDTYQEVQTILERYSGVIREVLPQPTRSFKIPLKCGICGSELKFQSSIGKPDYYKCSKHSKIRISPSELDVEMREVVDFMVHKLDTTRIMHECRLFISKKRQELKSEANYLNREIYRIAAKISERCSYGDYVGLDELVQRQREAEIKLRVAMSSQQVLKDYENDTKALADDVRSGLVKHLLSSDKRDRIAREVVHQIRVLSEERVQIELYYSEYFSNKEAVNYGAQGSRVLETFGSKTGQ